MVNIHSIWPSLSAWVKSVSVYERRDEMPTDLEDEAETEGVIAWRGFKPTMMRQKQPRDCSGP